MSLERLKERIEASKRLNQLIKLRKAIGQDDKWLDAEISDIEAFLKETEEQTA